ncbi:hypothetical protein KIW84_015728 [Lathyrus oleraceus]|uniref:Uncharacterized protein n=1 Tax=Pisum sativum TaxID=3888 RepID=A0A9D5BRF3_PEA|nr:hypothetical protein KIW84_015728 [Pisum sativum]
MVLLFQLPRNLAFSFQGNSSIEGLIVSIFIAGVFIGSISIGSLVGKLGCRLTFQIDAIPLILGAIISANACSLDEILWGRFLVGLGMQFAVDSPRWLCKAGRINDAKNKNDGSDLDSRWSEILQQPCSRGCIKFAGINIVLYFSSLTFHDVGIQSSDLASLFVGLTNFAGALCALYLIDKEGRQKHIIGSYLGIAISMFLVVYAIIFPLDEHLSNNLSILGTIIKEWLTESDSSGSTVSAVHSVNEIEMGYISIHVDGYGCHVKLPSWTCSSAIMLGAMSVISFVALFAFAAWLAFRFLSNCFTVWKASKILYLLVYNSKEGNGQLNNLELAVSLAKRGNLPGAEKLVVEGFHELFSQTKYKEAAELAVESPQGILRTPDTVAKFQSVPVQAGQTPSLLQYFGTLFTRVLLNA